MSAPRRAFDSRDSYADLLRLANTSDTFIRSLIQKADEEDMAMRDRVLYLPATLGDLYGHKVVFDEATDVAYIKGNIRTRVDLT